MAGLVVNGVRVLDLAASGDPAVSVRRDARRASSPLDRDINRMQQTPPSGYAGPGVMDELVYSGAGSGCRDDDEDACVLPDAGSGDDLITPVYVPSTRRPPSRGGYKVFIVVMDELVYSGAGSGCLDDDEDACVLPDAGSGDDLITPVYVPSTRRPPSRGGYKGDTSGKLMKPCDDEDCIEGSGSSGEDVTEPDHPTTTSGASSTHSMTSITTAGISSTHHEEKAVSSTTFDLTTGGRPTDRQTTAPDHDNMHAGTHPVAGEEKRTTPIDENTYTEHQYTPTVTKHTPDESTHTTEEEIHHIPEYEDRHEHENEIDTRTSTYELEGEQDRIPGKVHPDYNGFEHDTSTKWYHPKTTDNRVVPPESEFFATIVGIVASVLIAIILVVIIVLKYVVFRLDPSYKVTEGKGYQQGASAALLGNQAHSSYQSGAGAPTGGAVRNLQPLPLNRNGSTPSAPLPTQPTKRDGIKEWYV
ncbi:unnamed protein product [Plutella xylostella]|uniref:(diamondback moth) hypothetical protein n=1 Tax=Plutella xylostella TaxID=51655 RepID=A0A8S4DTW7_PLUXY|nr:unnamed protein product [Plutella xylostella]